MTELGGTWVFAECEAGSLTRVAREVLTEGRRLADATNSRAVAVLVGQGLLPVAEEVGRFGADYALVIDDPSLRWYSVLPYCAALVGAVEEFEPITMLFGATPLGNDLAPRVAARLRKGLVCDCNLVEVGPDGDLLARKPTYGGKASSAYRFTSGPPHLITLAPGTIETRESMRKTEVIVWNPASTVEQVTDRLGVLEADPERVCLAEAQVIVAAGRGAGSREGFAVVEELARALRASVGGTRVAVDQGWIPFERQVGQTGKSVAPKFYVTLGTSGAVQYTQGFREAEYVLAVDKNPNATVFDVADVGVVADLKELLPVLVDLLRTSYRPVSESGPAAA